MTTKSTRSTAMVNTSAQAGSGADVIRNDDEALNRLIADPDYRIQVVVWNNYPATLQLYQNKRMDADAPGIGTLALRLQLLRGSGHEEAVNSIINAVPWLPGKDPILDGAYAQLKEQYDDAMNRGEIDALKMIPGISLTGTDFMGIGAMANAVAGLFGGQTAADAAALEQQRLRQQAELLDKQEQAAKSAFRRNLKLFAITAGVVVVVVVVVLLIRRK